MGRELRKIVIINTADQGGGAERVSMTVLDGFLELGLDAWLLAGNKTGNHERVIPFHLSPFFDYRPYMDPDLNKEVQRRRTVDQCLGIEDFNHPYSHHVTSLTGSPPDLVLCHNLHGGYFDLRALPSLSQRVPVAVRLFDTWLQTGHCAYSLGCGRWQTGCGECPDLTIPPAILRDASDVNFRRKQRIFEEARLFVSAESDWMLDRAKRSLLAPAAMSWKHIPGGVDREVFYPGSRKDARRQLDLDLETKVILYVAAHGEANPYKDFGTVRRALDELQEHQADSMVMLLVVGSDAPDEHLGPGVLIRHAGNITSQQKLAVFYRAADIVVHSAIEETFGNVVAEAMACGTPVIAASGGGVVELIDNRRTGIIVPTGQPAQLAEAIRELLNDSELRARLGIAATAAIRDGFDSRDMIRNLQSWCNEVHSAWHGHAKG